MGISISNIEGCHKWKKVWWLSNFYFKIKWLMWILLSLLVAMGTVSTWNATCYDLRLPLLWLTPLLKLLPKVLQMTFSLNKKKTRQKKRKKKLVRLQKSSSPVLQSKSSNIQTLNSTYPTKSSIFHSKKLPQIRQSDLPHSSCKVSGKGGNGTGKEGRRPPATVPSHSSHPK